MDQMGIDQAIQNSYQNFNELKQKIFFNSKKSEEINFSGFYCDGSTQDLTLDYWAHDIFKDGKNRVPYCSGKYEDITIIGGILKKEDSDEQSQETDESYYIKQKKYLKRLKNEGFKFEAINQELQIPYEEPQENQAIIKIVEINFGGNYTCPVNCLGLFLSNSNISEKFRNNELIKEMGLVKDKYDLYIYMKKHKLEVAETNIDFVQITMDLDKCKEKPILFLNKIQQKNEIPLIQKDVQFAKMYQNFFRKQMGKDQIPIDNNQQSSGEFLNRLNKIDQKPLQQLELFDKTFTDKELNDMQNFQYCFFKIQQSEEIHPLFWFRANELSNQSVQNSKILNIPKQCQIGSKFICLRIIDKFQTIPYHHNMDITSVQPFGVQLNVQKK